MKTEFILNGKPVTVDTYPGRSLLSVIREDFGLTGAKEGCGEGLCGACTVVIGDRAVRSCTVKIENVAGKEVTTIEGLEKDGQPCELQKAFVRNGAVHCGYCTPGMIMTAYSLLLHDSNPSEETIRKAISGNICRCSDYSEIVSAVKDAAKRMLSNKNE